MPPELSKGKARTFRRRSSDLVRLVVAEREPSEGRRKNGQFDLRNPHGRERGLKCDRNAMFVGTVGRQARRRYRAIVRQLGLRGEVLEGEAAAMALERAREAVYVALALAAGLDTPEGRALDDRATRHGERAERRLVTLLDCIAALTGARGGRRKGPARPTQSNDEWLAELEEGSKPRGSQ